MVDNPDNADADRNDWTKICGTGPYILDYYVENSYYQMVRNPNYWATDERFPENKLPYIDTVKVYIIGDEATAKAQLRTGKIDFDSKMTIQNAQSVMSTVSALEMLVLPDNAQGLPMRITSDPLDDLNVRKALQMAIDYEGFANTYYSGLTDTVPAGMLNAAYQGFALPFSEWPASLQAEYTYNPEEATKLLTAAGVNSSTPYPLLCSSQYSEMAQIIKSYFADVGFNLDVKAMDPASSKDAYPTSTHFVMDRICNTVHGPSRAIGTWKTGNRDNFTSNNDATYDALANAYSAATSEEAAAKAYQACNQYFLEQHWEIIMPAGVQPVTYWPSVHGYTGQNLNNLGIGGFFFARMWLD
jgi:ABC-type transport system substrate-binding protein